ncbi:MAG: LysR family transcriptional regulator [Hyphomicrobiales bacterium]
MLKHYEQRFPWNLNWNLLRTYMVVVEQNGITLAADFLGLKQPTISSSLKQLEEIVNCKLVERKPNSFKITPAGEVLYAECSSIFGAISQIPALLEGIEEEVTGHIAISMASHVVSKHFDETLERFNEIHPKVTYSISIAESAEVQNQISQNRASFGICLIDNRPKNLNISTLFREYFAMYCGSKHRLFNQKNISIAELEGEDSVSFQTDIESGPLFSVTSLRTRALMKPELKGISSNLPEVRRMIISNIGIGALPIHVAQRDVELGNLRQLPPYTKLPTVDIQIISNPKRSLNAAETILLKMLNDMIQNTPLRDRTYK